MGGVFGFVCWFMCVVIGAYDLCGVSAGIFFVCFFLGCCLVEVRRGV